MRQFIQAIISLIVMGLVALSHHAHAAKTILITAASSGIGHAVCERLACEGYDLILAGRTDSKIQQLKNSLELKYSGKYQIFQFDYQDLNSIAHIAQHVSQKIDGLVIIPPRSSLQNKTMPTPEQWTQAFHDCIISPLEFIRLLGSHMNKNSSVVIISGISSEYYLTEYANSNVLRIAWNAEVKNLATQFALHHVRFNLVVPYIVLTDHHVSKIQNRAHQASHTYDQQLILETQNIPTHRYSDPHDVACSVSFLLGPHSQQINGSKLVIDGGVSTAY